MYFSGEINRSYEIIFRYYMLPVVLLRLLELLLFTPANFSEFAFINDRRIKNVGYYFVDWIFVGAILWKLKRGDTDFVF